MKLRDLRGAIRKPGNPSIVVELTPGKPMTLPLQKTPLLEELGRAYADGGETGLTYDPDTGILRADGAMDDCPDLEDAMADDIEEDDDIL